MRDGYFFVGVEFFFDGFVLGMVDEFVVDWGWFHVFTFFSVRVATLCCLMVPLILFNFVSL